MKDGKKCRCIYAVIAAIAAILVITYVWGYSIGDWSMTTWLAVFVIILATLLCVICRLRGNERE